jgi:hypothetical protein
MIAAAGLTAKGWSVSSHEPGTTNDPDYWFLVQSSLMQIASMVPIFFSFFSLPSARLQPRVLSWAFLGLGTLLAIMAPALYTIVPTEYSSVIAFCASVFQMLIVLEAMFLIGSRNARSSETDSKSQSQSSE